MKILLPLITTFAITFASPTMAEMQLGIGKSFDTGTRYFSNGEDQEYKDNGYIASFAFGNLDALHHAIEINYVRSGDADIMVYQNYPLSEVSRTMLFLKYGAGLGQGEIAPDYNATAILGSIGLQLRHHIDKKWSLSLNVGYLYRHWLNDDDESSTTETSVAENEYSNVSYSERERYRMNSSSIKVKRCGSTVKRKSKRVRYSRNVNYNASSGRNYSSNTSTNGGGSGNNDITQSGARASIVLSYRFN